MEGLAAASLERGYSECTPRLGRLEEYLLDSLRT